MFENIFKKNQKLIFFRPGILGLLFNPFYIIRRGLYFGIRSKKQYMNGKILDFGCGSKPWKDLFVYKDYIGLDIKLDGYGSEDVDVFYDGNKIPFDDCSFDSIFSSEVLEHVFNLDDILKEMYRVLRSGGYCLLTLPFCRPEHYKPYDFARYSSYGLKHICIKHKFDLICVEPTTSSIMTIFQLFNAYIDEVISESILNKNKFIITWLLRGIIKTTIFPFISLCGLFFSLIMPKRYDLTNNFIVVLKK